MEHEQVEPQVSIDEGPFQVGSRSKNGIRRLLAILVGVVLCGAMLVYFGPQETQPGSEPSPDPLDLELTEMTLNLSLLSQQLDELFQFFTRRVAEADSLTPDDRLTLESWLEFDERFIERVQNRETLKFERVNAHLRLGHGLYLLQMTEPSIAHFKAAIELLNELLEENPMIASYRLDQSDAYYALSRSIKVSGRNAEALEAIEAAIRIVRDPRFPADSGRQERLAELYKQKRDLLAPNVNAQ